MTELSRRRHEDRRHPHAKDDEQCPAIERELSGHRRIDREVRQLDAVATIVAAPAAAKARVMKPTPLII